MRAMALSRIWKQVDPYSRSNLTQSDLYVILFLSKIRQQSETAQNNAATLPNGRVSLYPDSPRTQRPLPCAPPETIIYHASCKVCNSIAPPKALVSAQTAPSLQGPAPSILATNASLVAVAADLESAREGLDARDSAGSSVADRRAALMNMVRESLSRAVAAAAGEEGADGSDGISSAGMSLADILRNYAGDGGGHGDSGGLFANEQNFGQEGDTEDTAEDAEELARKRQEELDKLRAELDAVLESLAKAVSDKDDADARARQHEADTSTELGQFGELEREYKVKKRTLDMLPKAEENMAKLRKICATSAEKLVTLGREWEKHRKPLVDEARSYRTRCGIRVLRRFEVANLLSASSAPDFCFIILR